ncbi:MAG: type II toxin-antitoxin system RelE/ParE family toxin [Pirellulales bacterium]
MIQVVEYEDEHGGHPFSKWFETLNTPAALKVRTAIARMENGNLSNVEPVGEGVSECKVHFGPGYRIYFGKDGQNLVILLGGGTKKRQSRDIAIARRHWRDYRARKRNDQN